MHVRYINIGINVVQKNDIYNYNMKFDISIFQPIIYIHTTYKSEQKLNSSETSCDRVDRGDCVKVKIVSFRVLEMFCGQNCRFNHACNVLWSKLLV
jgi:hypothetical protein